MGEVHELPLYRVVRAKLGDFDAFATDALDDILTIFVSDDLDDEKAAKEARRVWDDWRQHLSSLSGAAIAWLCHAARAAGRHTGPTLSFGAAAGFAAGAMLVVVSSAPIPPQAGRPAVMAPQGGSDVETDPPPIPLPVKPAMARPGSVPAAPRGHAGAGGLPAASQGPVASALASAGVPTPGHPLKPTRTMVASSVRSALPSAVPMPSRPVRCVVQVVLRDGKPVTVKKCL